MLLDGLDHVATLTTNRGASDGLVTDFGPVLSVCFVDPDGLQGEVCIENPDAIPGVFNPPGTPAARYLLAGTDTGRASA